MKDLERRQSEEEYKQSKRYEDRKVIVNQIKEREHNKLIALDMREQENMVMKIAMKRYEKEDRLKMEKRQVSQSVSYYLLSVYGMVWYGMSC